MISLFDSFTAPIIASLIVGLLLLFLEYRTHWFANRLNKSDRLTHDSPNNQKREGRTKTVSAQTGGNSSPAIAIGGNMANSNITVGIPPEEILSSQATPIVDQILRDMEAISSPLEDIKNSDIWTEALGHMHGKLNRDAYDIRTLIIRAQFLFSQTVGIGGKGIRQAFDDYQHAAKTDNTIADPYLGIGTILYYAALFDLAKRGRYRLVKKGSIKMGSDKGIQGIRQPSFEISPDNRTKILLQSALYKLEHGRKFKQIFDTNPNGTVVFFAPPDIENRIRSIRQILEYEPTFGDDREFGSVFSRLITLLNPVEFPNLYEVEQP